MVKGSPPSLSANQLISFSKALADQESFTVMYELVHSSKPITFEGLRKTFGADPTDIGRILTRLVQLGIAEKRGQAFVAGVWAAQALDFLEQALSTPHLEENVDCAAGGGGIDVVMGSAAAQGSLTATMNGAWVASIVNVGANAAEAFASAAAAGTEEPVTDRNIVNAARDDTADATRSHIYK
jgi:hypothetical protein